MAVGDTAPPPKTGFVPLSVTTDDTLPVFREAVEHHLAGKEVVDLVVNAEALTFIDSAGLEYLLDVQEELAKRFGQVKLVKCGEIIGKILEVTGLAGDFEQYDRVADAMKAVQA